MKKLLCLVAAGLVFQGCATSEFHPEAGFVPDAATAIKIAEAVWTPIYGREQIEDEKPFKATLDREVWTITGSLRKGFVGGVATAKIKKRDGKVIEVFHGK
jgi:hypothetical protein